MVVHSQYPIHNPRSPTRRVSHGLTAIARGAAGDVDVELEAGGSVAVGVANAIDGAVVEEAARRAGGRRRGRGGDAADRRRRR